MVQNQARRQDLATEVSKNQKGGHIFKIPYYMYAATEGPNVKWGGTDIKWGSRAPLAPPLATALCRTSVKHELGIFVLLLQY